jgi:hypothetical protein
MKIYVASSWRNTDQSGVVHTLRAEGHDVYDFRDSEGFHWSQIDKNWESWSSSEFKQALNTPLALRGFASDLAAMKEADLFVLVMPCGNSAHLELGWAAGAGKKTIILLAKETKPELMYSLADHICEDIGQVIAAVIPPC